MKKTLLSLVLVASLLLSVMLVACDDGGNNTGDDYEDNESRLPVESHEEDPSKSESETEKETDSALGVVEDTEEGWGEVHQ